MMNQRRLPFLRLPWSVHLHRHCFRLHSYTPHPTQPLSRAPIIAQTPTSTFPHFSSSDIAIEQDRFSNRFVSVTGMLSRQLEASEQVKLQIASNYTVTSGDMGLFRVGCATVIKGNWDNLLKPKIASAIRSATINRALLFFSLHGYSSLAWQFYNWVESIPDYKHSLQSSWIMIHILTRQRHYIDAHELLRKIAGREFLSSPSVLNALLSSTPHNPEVNSHVLSWLVILYAYSKVTHDAIQVFEHMRVHGLTPHLHACCVLLNSLVKDRLTDTVWKLYKKMVKMGIVPNLHVFNVLIHACAKSGDVEKAEQILAEMEFRGVLPDLFTYNTLISLYSKKGMNYEALCIQDRMEKEGVCPDIVTYNSLIHGYCKEGRMREALRLFKEIKGATPNHVTYTTLIDGYCRANDVNEALILREEMEAKGLSLGVVTYNSILRKLCEERRMKEANKLLNEMNEKKVVPDNITYNTLISEDRGYEICPES